MATINRTKLISDIKFWLTEESDLEDSSIAKISEPIIDSIGDDEDKYPSILYNCLRSCALRNMIGSKGEVRARELDGMRTEYFKGGNESFWRDYIKNLKSVAPSFGYKPTTSSIGMYISPGDDIEVNPLPDLNFMKL